MFHFDFISFLSGYLIFYTIDLYYKKSLPFNKKYYLIRLSVYDKKSNSTQQMQITVATKKRTKEFIYIRCVFDIFTKELDSKAKNVSCDLENETFFNDRYEISLIDFKKLFLKFIPFNVSSNFKEHNIREAMKQCFYEFVE